MIALFLAALQAEAAAPAQAVADCAPGVYVASGVPETLTLVPEQVTSHRKVGGMPAFMLLGGFTSMTIKTVLPGKAAMVRATSARPRFVFCFAAPEPAKDEPEGGAMAYVGASTPATSPREFRLVRFDVAGDQREAPLSGMSVTGPKTGAVNKSTIRFDVEEVAPGRHVVTPRQDLAPGEYGFLKTTGNINAHNTKKTPPERVFDFAVD